MSHNGFPITGQLDPTQTTSREQLAVANFPQGNSISVSSDKELYDIKEVWDGPVSENGVTLSVVAEVQIPSLMDGTQSTPGYDSFVVAAATHQDGRQAYTVFGLRSEYGSKPKIVQESNFWLVEGGLNEGIVGSSGNITSEQLWGKGKAYSKPTSEEHIKLSREEDGSLTITSLGSKPARLLVNPQEIIETSVTNVSEMLPIPSLADATTKYGGFEYRYNDVIEFGEQLAQGLSVEATKKMWAILFSGKDIETGADLRTGDVVRNVHGEIGARERLAQIYAHSPNTYNTLRDNEVVGFHGTRSSALAGIVKTGELRAASLANENDVVMVSGEHFRPNKGQDSISFSTIDDLVTPYSYSQVGVNRSLSVEQVKLELRERIEGFTGESNTDWATLREHCEHALQLMDEDPQGLEATMLKNDFPVLLGVNGSFVEYADENPDLSISHAKHGTIFGQSGQSEFRPISKRIPVESLVFIVPKDRVSGMEKLLEYFGRKSAVVAIEDIDPDGRYKEFVPKT